MLSNLAIRVPAAGAGMRPDSSGWRVPPMPEQPAAVDLFGVPDPADFAWLRGMLSDAM